MNKPTASEEEEYMYKSLLYSFYVENMQNVLV